MANWTANDIPDQTGKVIVITGANSGLGFWTSVGENLHLHLPNTGDPRVDCTI